MAIETETEDAKPIPFTGAAVVIDYTNHRGERSARRIVPGHIHMDEAEWHPGEQWLLEAYDIDKEAARTFAMKDIHSWRPATGGDFPAS